MPRCLIALGANLGDAAGTIRAALVRLASDERLTNFVASSLYATAPTGGPAQPSFVNAAAAFDTALPPDELLTLLQSVEQHFGRVRQEHWGPRTLDLDLLLYDDARLETRALALPHPRMAFRRFVLAPAAEIAPAVIHPTTRLTLHQLLMHLDQASRLIMLASSCWLAKQYVAGAAAAAIVAADGHARASTARGVTLFGRTLIESAEHPAVDHFVDLIPRLACDLQREVNESSDWLVCGFWPAEIAVFARQWFAGEALAAAEKACAEAVAMFPSPALVVYLDTPDDLLIGDAAPRDALREQIDQLAGVPLLKLSAAQPEAAVREIAAAALAMQPVG